MKADNSYCPILVSLVIFHQEFTKTVPRSNWNIQEGRRKGGRHYFGKTSLDLLKFCNSDCTHVRIKTRCYWCVFLILPIAPTIVVTHQSKYFIAMIKTF